MAQQNLHADTLVCRVGVETTFGTTATNMIRVIPDGSQIPLAELTTEMLPVKDLSPHAEDARAPQRGLQRGSVKLRFLAKRLATRITAAVTPVAYTNSAALSHQILMAHWFGGENTATGSTLNGALSAAVTSITVTSGTPFSVGQMIGIVTSAGLQAYLVTSKSGAALGIWPALRASAADLAVVTGSYTYFRPEAHDGPPLTFEAAQYESGTPASQRRLRGVYGGAKVTFAVGQETVIEFAGEGSAHDGPGNLSIPLTAAADDMGAALGAWVPEVVFQTGSTYAVYTCHSFAVDVPNAWHWITEGSGTGARNGATRVKAKDGPATFELKLRMDAAEYTSFEADTSRYLMLATTVGTGTSARITGVLIARAAVTMEPAQYDENGLVYVTLKGIALQDTATAGSPAASTSTDLSRSPIRYFML